MTTLLICPHCKNDDDNMIDAIRVGYYFCLVCGKTFEVKRDSERKSNTGREDTKT